MADYDRDIQNAVAGVSAPATISNVITFKNGVKLKRKNFSIITVQKIVAKFKYPEIPEYWDEDRKRGIKNPDHPVYKRECEEVDAARGMAVIDAIIAFGTEFVSAPDDVEKLESDSWVVMCDLIGIPVLKDNHNARYLAWVQNVAITDNTDLEQLMSFVQAAAGVPGDAVMQAIDSFPNHSQR